MSKDIRSFFKPLAKTTSSNQTKDESKNSEKQSKPKTLEKTSKKDASKQTNKSTKPFSNSSIRNASSRSVSTVKDEKNMEVISSDSDTCLVIENQEEKREKNSKTDKKNLKKVPDTKNKDRIEIVSSDSEPSSKVSPIKKSKKIKRDGHSKNELEKYSHKTVNLKKLGNITKKVEDSDDDVDIINPTPERLNMKKRKLQINSDSEDDTVKTKYIKKIIMPQKAEKLKPVNVSDIFSGKVNQSKEKTAIESPTIVKKAKKVKTELGIHDDKKFEKTLIDLDDDIFLQNEDILDKTIEGAIKNSSELEKVTKKQSYSDEDTKIISTKNDISEKGSFSPIKNRISRKRQHEDNEKDETLSESKKTKLTHTDSGFDDQERYEKKKYCAMQYQQYLNRGGPKNHGSKELPKGKVDCLSNLIFLRTGVLDSLESEEFENLIKEHGGKVVHSVSKKVNYVVVGEDPGPTKLQKAENYKIPTLSEDELLDMILQKSGMPKKYTVLKTSSFEDAGINDSFVSNESEEVVQPKAKRSEVPFEKKSNEKIVMKGVEYRKSPIKTSVEDDTKKDISNIEDRKIEQKYEDTKKEQIDGCIMSLSEKYKPKELKQIIGQQVSNSNMNKLKKWLECWHVNEKLRKQKKIVQPKPWDKNNDGGYFKCALLSGPPGVGKTTTATLVAESLGFDIVEFNASDTRSQKLLQREVANALSSQNISSFNIYNTGLDNKRVILMDEVDGMAGNEDRGGMQELISLIKISKIPIICMCNDRNHQKMRTLSNYCFDLRFDKPKAQQILGFVMSICCKEGIQVNPQIATEIINGTTCDIRQTLNQLSMLSNLNTGISLEQAQKDSANAKKDTVLGPWQVCKMVFNETDQKDMSLIDKSRLFFYDYSLGPLFIQENYLKVQPHVDKKLTLKHVSAAAEAISMGASIDKKIRESNNWSLLDLQAIYSSVLPGHYMSGQFTGAIDFPSWLGKNSKRNKIKRLNNELSMHTRIQTSGGSLAMNLDYSRALLMSIVTPLKKKGMEGVSDAVEVMKTYQLLREDLDSLVEFCTTAKQKNMMDGVESKVKAAFTRLYNKEVPIFSYSANSGFSKKKNSVLYDDNELGDNEDDETSETEDKIENDNLIKTKSKSKTQNKKETAKTKTSNPGSKSKGKGKGKK